jgi:hypothetical protein
MLPLVARTSAAASLTASNGPAGRVSSVLAAHSDPVARRSRFGATIAPTTATPAVFPAPAATHRALDARKNMEWTPASIASDRHAIRRSITPGEIAVPATPPPAPLPHLPGVAPASAGARFLEALHERPADPVRPVPAKFAPLARAIAGPRPVAVRSGPSTSRALRKAGKRAATVDNIVHFASSPENAAPSTEVFAHELVHAARPSPIPRFFDDDRHSPEEELARATGNLMRVMQPPTIAGSTASDTVRRSDATDGRAPTFGTAGFTVGASGGLMSALAGASPSAPAPPKPPASSTSSTTAPDATIRRSTASRPAAQRRTARRASAAGATSSSSSTDIVRRSAASAPSLFASSSGASSAIIRRFDEGPSAPPAPPDFKSIIWNTLNGRSESATSSSVQSSNTPAMNELISHIVEAIEERVIAELERRGRRHNPGVF